MATVCTVKKNDTQKTVTLTVEDGGKPCRLCLTQAYYEGCGAPVRGTVLDGEQLAELSREDERVRCLRYALYLLSFSDNSERRLLSKLCAKGFSRALAAEAVREAVSLGYLDEERQLSREVMAAYAKLYGRRRIVASLAAKGYRTADIAAAIERLVEMGEIDFEDNFRRLLDKRGDGSDDTRRKLRYTYGYGGESL